jgi:hypothetical protein
MRTKRWISAGLVALALAIAPVMLSASDSGTGVKDQNVSTAKFTALKDVKAVPMSSEELRAIKGQDAHFRTVNSQNELFGQTGLHVVVRNNRDHWLDLGNGILVAPAYRGLCDAALKSPGIVIPGQNPSTGVGGGC